MSSNNDIFQQTWQSYVPKLSAEHQAQANALGTYQDRLLFMASHAVGDFHYNVIISSETHIVVLWYNILVRILKVLSVKKSITIARYIS